ncbi:hypothetical protein T439DRAFT_381461 [Meredithblackwellia eburnea MCA 4105]
MSTMLPHRTNLSPSSDTSYFVTEMAQEQPTVKHVAPTLPPELISMCLLMTLPPRGTDSQARLRNSILKTYCHINREWRRFAQALLFRHAALPSYSAAQSFLAVGQLPKETQSLALGSEDSSSFSAFDIPALVKACPAVRELSLCHTHGLKVDQLFQWNDLTALTLHYVEFEEVGEDDEGEDDDVDESSVPPLSFVAPNLKFLKLCSRLLPFRFYLKLLTPEVFPALAILGLDFAYVPLKRLAPQIQVLSIRHSRLEEDWQSSWTSLKGLDLGWIEDIDIDFYYHEYMISATVTHLRLSMPFGEFGAGLNKVVDIRNSWGAKLKEVDVNHYKRPEDDREYVPDSEKLQQGLERVAKEGITVTLERWLDFEKWAEHVISLE